MEDKEKMNVGILNSNVDGTMNNKGDCEALADYINYEDEQTFTEGKEILANTTSVGVETSTKEATRKIDSNLWKIEDKFYGLVISPSEDGIKSMGGTEEEIYANSIKLMIGISKAYAQNFNHRGIDNSSNLVMSWKPHFTKDVNGEWQLHIHDIISRK